MRKSKAKYILLRIKSRRLHNKVLERKKSTNCYRELYKEQGDQPTSSSPSPVERRGVALCKANSHATAAPTNKTKHVHPHPRKGGGGTLQHRFCTTEGQMKGNNTFITKTVQFLLQNHTVTSEASSSKTMQSASDMSSRTAQSKISSAVRRINALNPTLASEGTINPTP